MASPTQSFITSRIFGRYAPKNPSPCGGTQPNDGHVLTRLWPWPWGFMLAQIWPNPCFRLRKLKALLEISLSFAWLEFFAWYANYCRTPHYVLYSCSTRIIRYPSPVMSTRSWPQDSQQVTSQQFRALPCHFGAQTKTHSVLLLLPKKLASWTRFGVHLLWYFCDSMKRLVFYFILAGFHLWEVYSSPGPLLCRVHARGNPLLEANLG